MYLIHFSVKTLVVLHVEFILIFLESKMATIFSRWPPSVLLHKLNHVTCVIYVLNYICFVRRISFS